MCDWFLRGIARTYVNDTWWLYVEGGLWAHLKTAHGSFFNHAVVFYFSYLFFFLNKEN